MFSSTAFNIISALAAQFLFEMGKQSYLSLLILCMVLSQGIAISSGENIGMWHDILRIKNIIYAHSNRRIWLFSITEFNFCLKLSESLNFNHTLIWRGWGQQQIFSGWIETGWLNQTLTSQTILFGSK